MSSGLGIHQLCCKWRVNVTQQQRQQTLFYSHYTGQPALPVKNWRILLVWFYMPLLTTTSAFGLGRRRWSSQQCYLQCNDARNSVHRKTRMTVVGETTLQHGQHWQPQRWLELSNVVESWAVHSRTRLQNNDNWRQDKQIQQIRNTKNYK